ncbi:MAG TPA: cation:dicarboxylase symporter family transporter [Methyloprofundus sp.]|uniref:cation:dicarboxylate symporter family transporter n=1 Tax=Methyloprofundus sp. TaxID=2020875 RepID=UPI0017C77EBF|nr:cation:dicarboxylase symporter family transporter [Methyloprofundus sp.]HIG64252.1 cation:dicarboxylase symporter family transporter [Methyloprofundus sp.]HIL79014.1 cation:dicarboxylase symporter family transporter [Methylococcales bacterium]
MHRILNLSFSTQVFVALCAGIFIGLFFGEKVAWLNMVGMVFIKLIQVAIIPYILLSLVTGLGSLSYGQSREIAKKFAIMLLTLWAIGLITIFVMALAFPLWESKDFFSTNQILVVPSINYYDLYIPSNPFKSLADNTVPAIVVFSLFLGGSLVNIKGKEQFISPAIILLEALNKITKSIVTYLPIGIFAIAAASAGTLQPEDFEKLEVYFVVYITTALILSFWVIPFFISTITPFKYADIVQGCRNILITAFASGNIFILLPIMTEACNDVFAKHNLHTEDSDRYNEIIIPIAYNFPAMGKLLSFIFLLFAAWFTNTELTIVQQLLLAFNGIFSLFANVHISIPFLLNYLHLPSDLYQLYLSGDVLTKRFSSLTTAIFLISFTLATTAYLVGIIQLNLKKILIFIASSILIIAIAITGIQTFFNVVLEQDKDLSKKLQQMQVDWEIPQNISYALQSTDHTDKNISTPAAIVKRGILRVGYHPSRVPFSYHNYEHELVGFDVEMMNHLSSSLGVTLEFIPFSKNNNLYQALRYYQIDIVISGVQISNEYLSEVLYTQPIMDLTTAFIVKDYRKKEFSDYSKFNVTTHLKLATMDLYPHLRHIQHNFPNIEIIKVSNPDIFFNAGQNQQFDGFISTIEEGMTLVMLHPDYAVTYDPTKLHRFPIGYAVHNGNLELQAMLNSWIDILKSTDQITKLYDYWIQGGGAKSKEPRWSILENIINQTD